MPAALSARPTRCFSRCPRRPRPRSRRCCWTRGLRVIDLSGAFRLRDAAARAQVVSRDHVIARRRRLRSDRVRARRDQVARACCRIRAATRLRHCSACLPLQRAGLLLPGADIVIDAKSGISGSRQGATERTHFSENHGSVAAYNPFGHRHTPEMEQALGRSVTFVPHLVPLDRGILSSLYARLVPGHDCRRGRAGVRARVCVDAPFVRLTGDALPEIKHVAHTNFCDIGWKVDEPRRRVFVVSVIDNLVKGAAGQAIQNFNVMCGFDEKSRTAVKRRRGPQARRRADRKRRRGSRRSARPSRALPGRRRWWWCMAAAARSTPALAQAGIPSVRWMAFASPMPRRWTSSSSVLAGLDQHAGSWRRSTRPAAGRSA